MILLEHIISLIAPHECVACGRESTVLCADCIQRIARPPACCYRCGIAASQGRTCAACRRRTPVRGVWTVANYTSTAKQAVHALKFGRARAAADDMGYAVARSISLPRGCLITHVPTVPRRVRIRGYDQAELIARAVSRHTGCPALPLLARQGAGRQVGKGRAARRQLRGAYTVTHPGVVNDATILLVDDVITTGATLEAAAQALMAAGAADVYGAVFARA